MIRTSIGWTLMFEVADEAGARVELRRSAEVLGLDFAEVRCGRYWKMPELWRCTARTEVEAVSAHEQVVQCLLSAGRLASGWYVLGPDIGPDGRLDWMEGIYRRETKGGPVESLQWAHYDVLACTTGG